MKNRRALARAFPKHGVGVEIGVFRGDFSEVLLRVTKPRALYLVDPWVHQPDTVYLDGCNRTRREFRAIYRNVKLRFARYATVHVIKAKSLRAVRMFDDASFDWIYIDGNHSYEAVRDDLTAWWPKLKPDGIFAGHDYIDEQPWFRVKPAVDEFALERGVLVGVTAEDRFPSWYIRKPK